MIRWTVSGLGLLLMLVLVTQADSQQQPKKNKAKVTEAVAVLHPIGKSKVRGVIRFHAKDGVVEITGEVTGLTPGKHGFHVHEYGDCSAPDGTSAGGHFDPTGMPHGGPKDKKRHVGDLGNITADRSGKAVINMHDKVIKLSGEHSILGRGLIIHGGADDLKSQPSGDAGARVACAVIGVANPKKMKKGK